MAEQVKQRISATEFLALQETQQKQELIEGEIIVPPAPVPQHQRIILRISKLVDNLIQDGEVFIAPADVYLDDDTVVQPDVFWISENSKCIETEKHFKGAPDLVVEILSPSTAIYDKREKFAKYEKHGVHEYWIIDPQAAYLEVWQLEEGKFLRIGIFGKKDNFKSNILGKKVILKDVF